MTFNKMRFPIVWITFALCVVLCSFEVHCGPVNGRQDVYLDFDQKDQEPTPTDFVRSVRQAGYEEESEEEDDDEEQHLNFPAAANGSEEYNDEDYDGRSLRRIAREASQKPVVEEEIEEESVIPSAVPEKKPSVLELLSSALDKAIEATSKIPTQQVASDAAGVFQILGQVFSEAIDKVIGGDDGPEENTEVEPESSDNKVPEEPPVLPVNEEPMKVVEEQQQEQEMSQSDKEIVNNL